MNVYEKLQEARVKLQSMQMKKSGKNKFANYDYFELSDFMPHVNSLFAEHKLFSAVSFIDGEATLRIVNSEKPDEVILFASPMSTADLKGCHQVQNLGAVQTYLRRYLYVLALEIVEYDALDSTQGKKEEPVKGEAKPSQKEPATRAQIDKINEFLVVLAEKTKITEDEVLRLLSRYPAKDGKKEGWLTKQELTTPRCSKGWAGDIIGKAEKMLTQ